MVTQEYLNALRANLHDALTLLETIHTRETTGRGPSFHTYGGQVRSTILEGKNLLNGEVRGG